MKFLTLLVMLLIVRTSDAEGGVLSGHTAVRCSAAPETSVDCDPIKISALEGKFATLIALDGSFSSKYSENANLNYVGPVTPSTGSEQESSKASFRLKDSFGFRFGPSIRLHFLDTLGLSFDAGYQWSSLGTESDDEQSASTQPLFKISYGGAYLGGTLFFPAQKIDKFGLMASYRRYLISEGDATMRLLYGSESKFKAQPSKPLKEMSIGFFGSIFYLSFAIREEGWKISESSGAQFSDITSNAAGVELGISGPLWYVWP